MKNTALNSKIKLLFSSYGEDIFHNRILQNQFIEFAKNFDTGKYEVSVLSFMPVSRTRLNKSKVWQADLEKTTRELGDKKISFTVSTLPALANWLYSSIWQFFFVHNIFSYVKLFLFIKKHKPQYIYCRGFHAGLAANVVCSFIKPKPAIQFDPRSLFIEEGIYLKKLGGISGRLWKRIERYLFEKSTVVSFVSEPFCNLLTGNYKIKRPLVVYTHVDVKAFAAVKAKNASGLLFCYVGQLDDIGWHRTHYLLTLFKALNVQNDSKLLIVTQSDHDKIREHAKAMGLLEFIEITRAHSSREVADLISPCHFALMSYKPLNSYIEETIAKTVVASKSGEYLAAGLPMICNANLHGIAELIERYGIGLTYQIGSEQELMAPLAKLLEDYDAVSKKCREIAQNYFDLKTNTQAIEDEIDSVCAR